MVLQEITDIVNDHVWAVAGIRLEDGKMGYSMDGPHVRVTYDDHELGILEYVEDPGEMADALIEGMGDVRARLTEIKRSKMEHALPRMKARLAAALRGRPHIMEELDFGIEVLADAPDHHGMSEQEAAQGYPDIVLVVTIPEGDRVAQLLNIYDPEDPLDASELSERILAAIG